MTISYDPEDTPQIPNELIRKAMEVGGFIVSVICEPHESDGEDEERPSKAGSVQYVESVKFV